MEIRDNEDSAIKLLEENIKVKDVIKEVREYIEKDVIVYYVLDEKLNRAFDKTNKVKEDILEILDEVK